MPVNFKDARHGPDQVTCSYLNGDHGDTVKRERRKMREAIGPHSLLELPVMASTGTGPQAPKVTLAVDASLPEGRDTIPVTVTATVEPSAEEERTLRVRSEAAET